MKLASIERALSYPHLLERDDKDGAFMQGQPMNCVMCVDYLHILSNFKKNHLLTSNTKIATIHRQSCANNQRSLIRAQPHNRLRHLFGSAKSPDGLMKNHLLLRLWLMLQYALHRRRSNPSWTHCVDPNSFGSILYRRGLG